MSEWKSLPSRLLKACFSYLSARDGALCGSTCVCKGWTLPKDLDEYLWKELYQRDLATEVPLKLTKSGKKQYQKCTAMVANWKRGWFQFSYIDLDIAKNNLALSTPYSCMEAPGPTSLFVLSTTDKADELHLKTYSLVDNKKKASFRTLDTHNKDAGAAEASPEVKALCHCLSWGYAQYDSDTGVLISTHGIGTIRLFDLSGTVVRYVGQYTPLQSPLGPPHDIFRMETNGTFLFYHLYDYLDKKDYFELWDVSTHTRVAQQVCPWRPIGHHLDWHRNRLYVLTLCTWNTYTLLDPPFQLITEPIALPSVLESGSRQEGQILLEAAHQRVYFVSSTRDSATAESLHTINCFQLPNLKNVCCGIIPVNDKTLQGAYLISISSELLVWAADSVPTLYVFRKDTLQKVSELSTGDFKGQWIHLSRASACRYKELSSYPTAILTLDFR